MCILCFLMIKMNVKVNIYVFIHIYILYIYIYIIPLCRVGGFRYPQQNEFKLGHKLWIVGVVFET